MTLITLILYLKDIFIGINISYRLFHSYYILYQNSNIIPADRNIIEVDRRDSIFITIQISEKDKLSIPLSNNLTKLSIESLGKITATYNKDQEHKFSFS